MEKNKEVRMGNACGLLKSETKELNFLEDDGRGQATDEDFKTATFTSRNYEIRRAPDREFANFWLEKLLQKNYTSSVFTAKRINWKGVSRAQVRHIHKKPATLAVKIAHLNSRIRMSVLREARMLQRISHLHVIKMSHCRIFTTAADLTYAFVFMPLFEMDLFTFITKREPLNKEPDLLHTLMSQVCGGVKAIHDAGIVHADIKTENVLVCRADSDMPFFCVADLGSAFDIKNDDYMRKGHTLSTSSPEIVAEAKDLVGPASDVFSLGCLLVDCMFRAPIFLVSKNGPREHLAKVQRLNLSVPFPRQVRVNRSYFNADGYLYNNSLVQLRAKLPWYMHPKYRPLFTDEVLAFIRKCCSPNPVLRPPVDAIVNYTFMKSSAGAKATLGRQDSVSLLTMETSINLKTRPRSHNSNILHTREKKRRNHSN